MRNQRQQDLLLMLSLLTLLLSGCGGIAARITPPDRADDLLPGKPIEPRIVNPYPDALEFQGEVWVTPVTSSPGTHNPNPPFIYPAPELYPAATTLPYPHPTFEPLPLPPTPTLNPAPEVAGIRLDAIEQLQKQLRMEPWGATGAARLIGWPFGMRSSGYCGIGPYQWLDDGHLLVYPLYGTTQEVGRYELSRASMVHWSLLSGWEVRDPNPITWFPTTACGAEPLWSPATGKLVVRGMESTDILSPDGVLQESFRRGSPLALSPSGEWLLFSNQYINLISGDTIAVTLASGMFFWPSSTRYAWDADEQQFFACCHIYGSLETGLLKDFDLADLWLLDSHTYPGQLGPQPFWTANRDRVMYLGAASFPRMDGTNPIGTLPLIDPVAGTYEDLRVLAGLSTDDPCELVAAAPDGHAALASCGNSWQLFDLGTYTAQRLNLDGDFEVLPSPNSAYFLLAAEPPGSSWLAAADGSRLVELGSLAAVPVWHPQENWVAYPTADGAALEIYQADTLERIPLPVGRGNFSVAGAPVLWDRAGSGLFFLTEDSRVGYLPDPGDGTTYLLTPPYPGLRDLQVSPGGGWIAFVSGSELYVYPVPGMGG